MQAAGIGQGPRVRIGDDQIVLQDALAQLELDLETEGEGIEGMRLGVVDEEEAQIVRLPLGDLERLLPGEAVQGQWIALALDRDLAVARTAHDREQDRRGLVPDTDVFGPDHIRPIRPPCREFGAEGQDFGRVAVSFEENRVAHGETFAQFCAACALRPSLSGNRVHRQNLPGPRRVRARLSFNKRR